MIFDNSDTWVECGKKLVLASIEELRAEYVLVDAEEKALEARRAPLLAQESELKLKIREHESQIKTLEAQARDLNTKLLGSAYHDDNLRRKNGMISDEILRRFRVEACGVVK